MKKTLLVLLLSSLVYAGNAQRERVSRSRNGSGRAAATTSVTTSHFGIGINAGLPIGEVGKVYSAAIGADLQYEVLPAPDLGITFSAGYLSFPLKSVYKTINGPNSSAFVPLLAGIKYYFMPNAFFRAQLGAAVGVTKDLFGNTQGTSFAYSPGVGVKLSPNFDVELKYLGIGLPKNGGTLGNVGLRLGYNF